MQWFPDGIHVVQLKDPGATGNFEITVNGELVHSKKTRGEGYFEAAGELQKEKVKLAIAKVVTAEQDSRKSTGDINEGLVSAAGGCMIL